MRRAAVVACALWLLACEQDRIEITPLDGGADGGRADAMAWDAALADARVPDVFDAGSPPPPSDGGGDGGGDGVGGGDDDGGVARPPPDAAAGRCIGFDSEEKPVDVAALRNSLGVNARGLLELHVLWLSPADDVFVVRANATPDAWVGLHVLRGECGGEDLEAFPYRLQAGQIRPAHARFFRGGADLFYTFALEISEDVDELTLVVDRPCTGNVGECATERDGAIVCGAWASYYYDIECLPVHSPGEPSALCPDTTFDGERVEGCCMPTGQCGHLDDTFGCYDLAMEYWPWELTFYCDERAAPDPPDYYECGWEPDPCEDDLDCCAQPNYGSGSCVDGHCVDAQG